MSKKNPVKLISLYLSEVLYNRLHALLQESNKKSLNALIVALVSNFLSIKSFKPIKSSKDPKDTRISFYCPLELYENLQILAKEHDRSMSYIINTILLSII